jgi:hypothetical protein
MRGKAAATLQLERAILEIVEERKPITVRGVCYALFVRQLIASMDVRETGRVSRIMTAMREAETLDWTTIVDASREVDRARTWDDPDAIITAAVSSYRRDYWQDQATVVEVWSEKGTVKGLLEPVLDELGVTTRIVKGFGSFTVIKQAAVESMALSMSGKRTVALYIGDHDPSGLHMSDVDLPGRLQRYGGYWKLKRIALLPADTRSLPHFDARTKSRDPRYRWFVRQYGRRCWELDAMDPNHLRARVQQEIERYIDWTLWNRAVEIEAAEVESMTSFHEAWRDRLASTEQ